MKDFTLKQAARVSLIYLGFLLILSIVFYRERIFADESFVGYLIINSGKFQIQVNRYGSFITQLVPLCTSLLHLPVKTIFLLYSISFNLFYLLVGLTLFFRFKEYALTILLSFYFSLVVSDSFFWTFIELHQGIGWMMLMVGFIRYTSRKPYPGWQPGIQTLNLLIFAALALLAIFSHPSMPVPLGFLWVFLWLKEGKTFLNNAWRPIACSGILALLFWFKMQSSLHNFYDGNIIARLGTTTSASVLDTFQSGLADVFWKGILHNYWILALLFLGGLAYLIRQRKWMLLGFVVISNLAFFMLLCLTFPGDMTQFYFEGEFASFSILGTAAFVYFGLANFKSSRFTYALVVLIFTVRLAYIFYASGKFTQRLAKVERIVRYMDDQKISKMIIFRTDNRLEEALIMGWGLPCEVAEISSMNGDKVTKTCINMTQQQLHDFHLSDSLRDIHAPFGPNSYNQINHAYFRYDTTQAYKIVSYEQIFGR